MHQTKDSLVDSIISYVSKSNWMNKIIIQGTLREDLKKLNKVTLHKLIKVMVDNKHILAHEHKTILLKRQIRKKEFAKILNTTYEKGVPIKEWMRLTKSSLHFILTFVCISLPDILIPDIFDVLTIPDRRLGLHCRHQRNTVNGKYGPYENNTCRRSSTKDRSSYGYENDLYTGKCAVSKNNTCRVNPDYIITSRS